MTTRVDILRLHSGWTDTHHDPKPDCKWCHGTGERHPTLTNGKKIVSPCICMFVEHEWVETAQDLINQTIANIRKEK